MYRELDPKRRPMRAIARLWNAQKEKTVPDCPSGQLLDGKSYMRSPIKEQELASGSVNHRRFSIWGPGPLPTKSDMDRLRRKVDGQNLSDYETNEERRRRSREIVSTSGRVDPRKLLMEYAKKRDALFADQKFKPSSSLSTLVLKPSSSAKYADNAIVCMAERNTGECDITYPKRIDGLLLEPQYRHRAPISCQTPTQSWGSRGSYYDAEFAGVASGGVRKLAREITNRIRGACDKTGGGMYPEENHPIRCGRRKIAMGYPLRKVSLSPRDSKSRRNKRISCPPLTNRESDSALEASFVNQMEAARDLSKEQMAGKDDCNLNLVADAMIDEQGSASLYSNESSASTHDAFGLHQGLDEGPPGEAYLSLHQLVVPISSENSKDADHPGPSASKIEVPSVEDASLSPRSFGKVRADLNEARMQLQLLKMESHAYNEISTLITNEEDIAYPSSSWESYYMLEVLIESGFHHFSFDTFNIMWQYPDYALHPTLFNNLEKKYAEETTGSRPERLLLFDRINSGIVEIFQDLVDLHPWLKPKSARLLATRHKRRTKDALMNLESAHWKVTERILLRDLQWEDHIEDIVLVGKEIEELLIDDLISQFLCECLI